MKKIISLLLVTVLILGSFSAIFADDAKSITVYVTVNDKCQLAKTRDNRYAAMLEIKVQEGANLDDVFRTLHKLYYPSGEEGYESEKTAYGISMVKAWGQDNGSSYGYYINNNMAFSCSDLVHDGDLIDLFVYKDMAGFSDLYTSAESKPSNVEGETLVSVSYYYFDENFALAKAALEGAEIYTVKNGQMKASGIKTDENGQCLVKPDKDVEFLAAVKEDCVVSVAKPEVYKDPEYEDFTDLSAGKWYETAIRYALKNKYCNGTGNNSFEPEKKITKAELLQMLWKMDGKLQANLFIRYDDVKSGDWYTEAVRWALAKGIIEPKSETEVGVKDFCTREEVASIIYKFIKSQGGGFTGAWMFYWDKADRAEVSPDCMEACMYVSMHKIMIGKSDSTFNPKDDITRAEVCQIVYNYLTNYSAK